VLHGRPWYPSRLVAKGGAAVVRSSFALVNPKIVFANLDISNVFFFLRRRNSFVCGISGGLIVNPSVHAFFDPDTSTISYVVHGEHNPRCAVIDPVLDYDPKAGRVGTHSARRILDFVAERQL